MTRITTLMRTLRNRIFPPMTKAQAELLATIKYPCC